MTLLAFLQDFAYAPMLPEIFLSVAAILLLMAGAFSDDKQSEKSGWLAILLLIITGALVVAQGDTTASLFDGAVVFDPFGRFMKLLILAGSAVTILLSFSYLRSTKLLKFEFPVLIMLATLGMMLMASAGDLISLYMALELQSLALYVLAAFRRDTAVSSEAGLKYFILGALSSGLLLYGCSLIYGFTGTTSFSGIDRA
jgi:NADH-quinone oxidoreductase subunit N